MFKGFLCRKADANHTNPFFNKLTCSIWRKFWVFLLKTNVCISWQPLKTHNIPWRLVWDEQCAPSCFQCYMNSSVFIRTTPFPSLKQLRRHSFLLLFTISLSLGQWTAISFLSASNSPLATWITECTRKGIVLGAFSLSEFRWRNLIKSSFNSSYSGGYYACELGLKTW